jgi:flavin-dependent dehydrogenase
LEETLTQAIALAPSLTIADAAQAAWDVVVIGAGPAGALAARQTVRAGLKVLLIEAKRWPREKVCGGCLNQRAMAVLGQLGLACELRRCGAVPIDEMLLVVGRRTTRFGLPPGLAISRATLDAQLVQAAVDAGVTFLSETSAIVDPELGEDRRHVSVSQNGQSERVASRVVIVADGLARSSLKHLPDFVTDAAANSRLGVGAIIEHDLAEYPAGRIVMIVSRLGYVGMTRVERDRLNIAAALDALLLQQSRSVGDAVASILLAAGLPVPVGVNQATWKGRPPLTSRPRRVAAERLFVVGDAGGYVEPFTGEGIAAAFESALAVSPLAIQGCLDWHPSLADEWEIAQHCVVREQQVTSRVLAWTLRRPWRVATALGVCRAFPPAANCIIRRINRQPGPCG